MCKAQADLALLIETFQLLQSSTLPSAVTEITSSEDVGSTIVIDDC